MGVILRLVFFVVGVLGLIFLGLNIADGMGLVKSADLFAKLGATPGGVATAMSTQFGAGLDALGGLLAKTPVAGSDPANPGLVVKYGPDVIAAVVSGLLVMFGMRR
jgi:hypothetical protein